MLHPRGLQLCACQAWRHKIGQCDGGLQGCAGQHAHQFLGDLLGAPHLRKVIVHYGNLQSIPQSLRNGAGPFEHGGDGSGENLEIQCQ